MEKNIVILFLETHTNVLRSLLGMFLGNIRARCYEQMFSRGVVGVYYRSYKDFHHVNKATTIVRITKKSVVCVDASKDLASPPLGVRVRGGGGGDERV